jgi:hypothetical protein
MGHVNIFLYIFIFHFYPHTPNLKRFLCISVQWVLCWGPVDIRKPELEAHYSPLSSAKVKKVWSLFPPSHATTRHEDALGGGGGIARTHS